ncbi:hypothetical protein ACP0HM_05255 [Escherichia coli]
MYLHSKGLTVEQVHYLVFLDEIGRSIPVGSWLVVEKTWTVSLANPSLKHKSYFSRLSVGGITIVTGMDGKVYSKESVNANPIDFAIECHVVCES